MRIEIDGRRWYQEGSLPPLPSVTTILHAVPWGDTTKLERWAAGRTPEQRIADDAHRDRSGVDGDWMHAVMEGWFGLPPNQRLALAPTPDATPRQRNLIRSIERCAPVRERWRAEGIEVVITGNGYAGTADLIGAPLRGLVTTDWKNSWKRKDPKFLSDYKHQIAAYAVPKGITEGLIVIAIATETESLPPQEVWLSGSDIRRYYGEFMQRVERFWELHGI